MEFIPWVMYEQIKYTKETIMIKIISPDQFKKIPWKNGKGITTELAINDGGTLEDFDWRISIAGVVEDGEFSDFSGYHRNLKLLEGNGIKLKYDNNKIDHLDNILSIASFDGACKTVGMLKDGSIKDFNVITRIGKYKVNIETYIENKSVELKSSFLCFIYSLKNSSLISKDNKKNDNTLIPAGNLLQLSYSEIVNLQIKGEKVIVIYFDKIKKN